MLNCALSCLAEAKPKQRCSVAGYQDSHSFKRGQAGFHSFLQAVSRLVAVRLVHVLVGRAVMQSDDWRVSTSAAPCALFAVNGVGLERSAVFLQRYSSTEVEIRDLNLAAMYA